MSADSASSGRSAGIVSLELAAGQCLGERRTVDPDPRAAARRLGVGIGQHVAVGRDRQAQQFAAAGVFAGQHAAALRPVAGAGRFRDVVNR